MELISAKNRFAMDASLEQLSGKIKNRIQSLRSALLDEIAYIEAALDDPEHISLEGYTEGLTGRIETIRADVQRMADSFDNGKVLTEGIRTVIVGKPNAGKSSITNRLLGYDRCIVSDIAGTTRDAIDTELDVGDDKYLIIDTAGMRKKKVVNEDLERYSVMRSLLAVRRADVVLVVCDATEGLTEQDVKIAGFVHEEGKPSVIVMNKWDLVDKNTHTIYEFEKKLKEDLKYMDYFKSVYISALSGKRLDNLLPLCKEVVANSKKRIPTGLLNEVVGDAIRISEPPSYLGKKLKIFYVTQVSVAPPTFVLKVNDPTIMHFSYKRYLENALRKSFDFSGTPIRLLVRANGESDK